MIFAFSRFLTQATASRAAPWTEMLFFGLRKNHFNLFWSWSHKVKEILILSLQVDVREGWGNPIKNLQEREH